MAQLRKEDIAQEVFDLYDDYAHNIINRSVFIEKLSIFAVGAITLPSLLSFISPDYVSTNLIDPTDPKLNSVYITYDSPKGGGKIKGLLSIPSEDNHKLPGVLVVHENRGLNPYIEDVARRTALAGFISLAPDALTPLGGYPGNDDEGREMQSKRDPLKMLEDFIAGYEYLKNHPKCNGKVGVVGFCFGGWIANRMAVQLQGLGAAVPFYGKQPEDDQAAEIKSPLLIQYASLDTRVNEGWPAYEKILKANNIRYEVHFYEGVNHGFHNNTTPRYDKNAATLAWERTIAFFKKNLV